MLDNEETVKWHRGHGRAWNRKRRFPPGSSGQKRPAFQRPGSLGNTLWQRKEGGEGSQQRDPKHKQSPKKDRNSQVGENMLVRFLSCLGAGLGEGAAGRAPLAVARSGWAWVQTGVSRAHPCAVHGQPGRPLRNCLSHLREGAPRSCLSQGCAVASSGKALLCPGRAVWKHLLKIDNTHFQGSGELTFSPMYQTEPWQDTEFTPGSLHDLHGVVRCHWTL